MRTSSQIPGYLSREACPLSRKPASWSGHFVAHYSSRLVHSIDRCCSSSLTSECINSTSIIVELLHQLSVVGSPSFIPLISKPLNSAPWSILDSIWLTSLSLLQTSQICGDSKSATMRSTSWLRDPSPRSLRTSSSGSRVPMKPP